MEYWYDQLLVYSQTDSNFSPAVVKSHTKRNPRLNLDLWHDVIQLGSLPTPYIPPQTYQIVTGSEEVVQVPGEISCDEIFYNMTMRSTDKHNLSDLTGDYDEDFPDLTTEASDNGCPFYKIHVDDPFKKRDLVKQKKKPKQKTDFCVVKQEGLTCGEDGNDEDEEEGEAYDMNDDEWEMVDHPEEDFELVDKETETDNANDDDMKKQGEATAVNKMAANKYTKYPQYKANKKPKRAGNRRT